ncbi:MAG: glutamine synthetase III [Oscillospiraceae bacterium]|nr:glutamine synthetase III [Oscillospiraceae bacterium]
MSHITDLPAIFGSDVFNETTMRQRLKPHIFAAWRNCIDTGTPLELDVANHIAEAMKVWATEKGATHYTHWFQPMTGITAEKHDSFLTPAGEGRVIMEFSGKELVRGEPDASSFPSGGLRATFEARGYTAWDPTSFAFVKDDSLFIPTCFFSYTGAALDKKTPLLRSIDEVSRESIRILRLFGDTASKRIIPCVGPEQEYFLIPRDLYAQREDLRLTGRTLFGAPAPKGQELDDHYFGTIRTRVSAYMKDLDEQLWRLGVLSKTKHNEAAPAQHEMAPIFSDANSACDSNQLVMEIMKKCAAKHNLVCLLHEKPFNGITGSGKHNNYSLSTDTGKNLFSPGKTPMQNAQFLVFLAAFLKGVDEYQDWLRSTAATAGNDHRLGADEAPPAIISVFLGDDLNAVVKSIIDGSDYAGPTRSYMRVGVDVLPNIPKDTTDRNRTSPVAFTGNKFEFRMLGASQSVADPNIVLNTIMAEELGQFADELEQAEDFDTALHDLVVREFRAHSRIIFDGNGYSEEWKEEAARRGLSNHPATHVAMDHFLSRKNIDLVTKHRIFTEAEFRARYEIQLEAYIKILNIEALTSIDMIRHQILPAAIKYTEHLTRAIVNKQKIGMTCKAERELAQRLSTACDKLYDCCELLAADLQKVPLEDNTARANYYGNVIVTDMARAREQADLLEALTDKAYWPYPTYSDLLFY